jgi:tetratricopeptide (TPR) repeat protein
MTALPEALQIAKRHHQTGSVQQAADIYRQVIQADPDNPQVQYLLGAACQALGRLDEASVYLEQSLRLRPDFAEAHNHLGVVRARQGKFDEAAACFGQSLRLRPDNAEAQKNLTNALRDQERRAARAPADLPRTAEECARLGSLLLSQNKLEEAIPWFREAVRLKPGFAEAHADLGGLLRRQARPDEAIPVLRRALELKPDLVEAHVSLGNALRDKARLEESVASYREAVRLRPDYPDAHNNLGVALMELGELQAAVASDREAMRLNPGYAEAHNSLGVALSGLGRVDEAVQCYSEAIRLRPNYADAYLNRAFALLLKGDFEQGWPEYEWRWRTPDFTPPNFHQPQWDGGPLAGRTVLLHAEQGLGDALQFIRYVPLVQACGGRIIVQCPRMLRRLLGDSLAGIEGLIAPGETPPPFQVHCPLLSLPHLLGTTLATIPAGVPYLRADEALVTRWRRELAAVDGFKVGVVWRGSPQHKRDRFRSVPLTQFGPLAAVGGVGLVGLQKGLGSEQIAMLPPGFVAFDAGARIDDWADTAAVVKSLDVVVTVDTAVAHLAGGLGVPVWVALPYAPDWRWLLGREDSPWYPTMRLFRQTAPGAWGPVFERIASALRQRVRR